MPNAATSVDANRLQLALDSPRPAPYYFLNPLAWFVLLALMAYQVCVPARYKPVCRRTPSCSRYMELAVRKYGVTAGVRLGWHRFRRCVGFGPRGEDWP
jgi:putative component of membrane protein insertase Oxa1/YidC/SpoIIIJ protein YidD